MPPATRVSGVAESVIREMTRLSEKYGAVNLSQGLPDEKPPEAVIEYLKSIIDHDYHQYSFTWGLPELRDLLSKKLESFNKIHADSETDITITCGTSEAIMAAVMAFMEHGKKAVVLEPFYENYIPAVQFSGGSVLYSGISPDTGKIDEEFLKNVFSSRPSMLILNNPGNPSGKVFSMSEMKLISDLCIDSDTLVLTDEIYEHLVYEGKHISMASLEGMGERTITCGGFSKTYSLTGWRVGYVSACPELSREIRKVHDYMTVCAPTFFQKALTKALSLPESYYVSTMEKYRKKRDFFCKSLSDAGFRLSLPDGAYYVMADFSGISSLDDYEFCHTLIKKAGLTPVPGSSFYSPENRALGKKYVRFSYAKNMSVLKDVAERLSGLKL